MKPTTTSVPSLRRARTLTYAHRTQNLLCVLSLALALGGTLAQTATDSLLEAAGDGNAEKVKAILDQKADINARSSTGRTSLMIAAMNGKVEVVKLLLGRGADARLQDNKGQTARQLAAEFSQDEVIKLLDQAQVAADPQAAFFAAVNKADTQAVRRALDQGADVNATMGLETTALMVAASKNNYSLLSLLLEKGATVNAVDNFDGRSAFDRGDTEVQRLLAEKGAITDGSAQYLNRSLRSAVMDGDLEKANAALAKKADPNLFGKNHQNESVLMSAARAGNLAMVKLLLKNGANPNR
ncbi:MAG: ankyrin repeat domain-containing protein, partial [Limisphaerales bacterium]